MIVVDILSKSNTPTDVSTLVKKLKINKTTVYRQLTRLVSDGKVLEIEFGDGKKRYELSNLDHHHHLICNKCKKVEDISFNENVILRELSKKTKFKVESHSLEFFGYCANCK